MRHHPHDGADAPGLAAPEAAALKDECPGGDRGIQGGHETSLCADIVADDAPACLEKRFATLAALLALKGYSLHALAGGGYLIARWDRTNHCSDLAQCRDFARRMGATR